MSGSLLRRNIELFAARTLSPEARSALLARTARQALADAQAGGANRLEETFVDGVPGASEDRVRPDGVILYRFARSYADVANAAAFALAYLEGRSPVMTGAFRAAFYLGIGGDRQGDGGRFVRATNFNPAAVTPDIATITIGNMQPYNRLVDVQMAGGQRVAFSVPADMYSDAAEQVEARFPRLRASRVYTRSFPGQYLLAGSRRPVQSPALVITSRTR
jgi:hypothetical protein